MKIDHLAIWVRDLELLREFYMKYFNLDSGEKYTNPNKNFSSYFLSFGEGKTRIELMTIPVLGRCEHNDNVTGLAHFSISVGGRDVVDALTGKLRSDGYTIASEPRTTGDGYYESAVFDPEGNYVEITE